MQWRFSYPGEKTRMFVRWRVKSPRININVWRLVLWWLLFCLPTLQCKMVAVVAAVAVTIILPQYRICRLVEKPGAVFKPGLASPSPPWLRYILCHARPGQGRAPSFCLTVLPFLLLTVLLLYQHQYQTQSNYLLLLPLPCHVYSQFLQTDLAECDMLARSNLFDFYLWGATWSLSQAGNAETKTDGWQRLRWWSSDGVGEAWEHSHRTSDRQLRGFLDIPGQWDVSADILILRCCGGLSIGQLGGSTAQCPVSGGQHSLGWSWLYYRAGSGQATTGETPS